MADTSKINKILNYYGLKTNIEETKKWIKQYVAEALTGITTDLMTNVTYDELVSLRDNNNLKPGMLYRMTDYVTKVYDEDGEITSAEHPFDLILTAINENTLDENAKVALHDGDEYFKDCNVEAWEVKYSLDNNTTRFKYVFGYKKELAGLRIYNEDTEENGYYYYIEALNTENKKAFFRVNTDNFENWINNPNFDDIDFNDNYLIDNSEVLVRDAECSLLVNSYSYISIDNESVYYNLFSNGMVRRVTSKEGKVRDAYFDNNSGRELKHIILYNVLNIYNDTYFVDDSNHLELFKYQDGGDIYYTGEYVRSETGKRTNYYYNILSQVDASPVRNVNAIYVNGDDDYVTCTIQDIFTKIIYNSDGKGYIYYMKDEWENEAPYDFKNILQKDGEYTFGNLSKDYSLQGNLTLVYENKILLGVDHETNQQIINKIRFTEENTHSNIVKPSCQNSYINSALTETDISMNNDGELILFKTQDFVTGIENKPIEHDYTNDYLTFEAVNDDTEIIFKTYTDDPQYTKTIEVSKDKVNWETKTSSSEGVILASLNEGEKLYLRGNNSSYGYYYDDWGDYLPNFILPLDYCYVYGNVMSLIKSEGFSRLRELTEPYTFYSLFYDYWNGEYGGGCILSHPEHKLVLPAITLAEYCYNGMFEDCDGLTTAPELPATTLAYRCYYSMFGGCTSLTTAPVLPATELANKCYQSMFNGCSSLATAPELPATTLASSCYSYMFRDCSSLVTAPALPATILAYRCYENMFEGCSNLNYIKCLAVDGINTNDSTSDWVYGVQTNSGTFVKHPDATSWQTGSNGIPTNWVVEDAVIE